MRPSWFLVCVVSILLCPGLLNAADIRDIFKENAPAVVLVRALGLGNEGGYEGSGFIVTSNGVIITTHHVIEGASRITVKLPSGKILRDVAVLYADEDHDLAILFADARGLPVLRLGDSNNVEAGDDVIIIGNPQGLQNTLTKGIISSSRRELRGRSYIQTTAAMSKGSSGGPLLNMKGEVIGVATFIFREAQNINFVIPVNAVKRALRWAIAELAVQEREIWDWAEKELARQGKARRQAEAELARERTARQSAEEDVARLRAALEEGRKKARGAEAALTAAKEWAQREREARRRAEVALARERQVRQQSRVELLPRQPVREPSAPEPEAVSEPDDSKFALERAERDFPSERPAPISLDTPPAQYREYFDKVRQRINAKWIYPQEAGYRGIGGQVAVEFVISKTGGLTFVELRRSSGNELLDLYVLNAIRLAEPFPPVPDSVSRGVVGIMGIFTYRVE